MNTRTAVAAALTCAGLVLAGCTAIPAPTGSAASSPSADFNGADAMFASMMIPHHQQAVEMSQIVLAKPDVDASVTTLAENIEAAQTPEIEQLSGWLKAWDVDESSLDTSHAGHGGGMMSEDDLKALTAASGAEAGKLFLEQMIVHHEGAVAMAQVQVDNGRNPDAIAMANSIIQTQNSEIEQMRTLLAQEGIDASGFLTRHGLAGMDARQIIERLDATPVQARPKDLIASVRPQQLLLSDDSAQTSLPMPADAFYLSLAPYVSQTHECHFHSLTTCLGELRNTDVRLTITDKATGTVIVDRTVRTHDNGFYGVWLPRDIDASLTVEHEGHTANATVSTRADDDATCLTTVHLT